MIKKTLAIVMCLAMFAPMFAGAQTYDINMLLQVIQQLQAQLAALQNNSIGSVSFDTNLSYGMTNNDVKALQEVLGVTPTSGYFGPLTLAAVKEYQANNGIPNTGFVGPLTRQALNSKYTAPIIAPITTLPVTPKPSTCNGEEGTLVARTTGVATVSTVYKYDTDKNVFAFELEAKNSDINVNRIDVNMTTSSSQLPWKVFNSLDLYIGGELVKSLTVNSSNLIENTYGTDYTARFAGLDYTLTKDSIKQVIVKANLGYPESTEAVTFKLLANGVRGMDCSGLDQYANSSALSGADHAVTPSASSVSAKLEIIANSQNVNKAVQTDANSVSYDVPALYFDVKNGGTETTTIKTIQVDLSGTTNISAVKLYDGSTLLSSKAAASAVNFTNLDFTLPANTQKTLTVKYDLAANTTGTLGVATLDYDETVAVSPSGDDVAESGANVTGPTIYADTKVPTLAFVNSSITITPDSTGTEADAELKFNVTANGGDLYFAKNNHTVLFSNSGYSIASITGSSTLTGFTAASLTVDNTGTGGTGLAATITVNATTGAITGTSISNHGSGYTSVPTVTLTDNREDATLGAVTIGGGAITDIAITDAGTGYQVGQAVTIDFAGCSSTPSVTIATVGDKGEIATFTIADDGTDSCTSATATAPSHPGTLPTFTAVLQSLTSGSAYALTSNAEESASKYIVRNGDTKEFVLNGKVTVLDNGFALFKLTNFK
ncbi:MAG: peptidoglycan-binding protein [Candidatus Pacebacteria bacterium]|nr:peptidoglycan-binding protein [Candidatus Paceibacterota bacterium]